MKRKGERECVWECMGDIDVAFTLHEMQQSIGLRQRNTLQHTATHCNTLQHTATTKYRAQTENRRRETNQE